MYLINSSAAHGRPLDPFDQQMLGVAGAQSVAHVLELRGQPSPTPLHALPGLAAQLGLSDLYLKDEGQRLGLGSFKALGGGYALMRLVQQQAARQLNRQVDLDELFSDEIRGVAAGMTFACATDGNHGRSVAQGAQLMGARAVIFVHSGVSAGRIAAISRFGAEVIRVDGNYDDSVAHAAKVAAEKGWTVLSDTSWPGYEEIPGLVMQGYTAIVTEALAELPELPTHIFLQAGVGGFAAAIAGHLAIRLGSERPHVTVVDPVLAPCIYRSAQAGHPVTVPHTHPTAMAMLECYAPSHVAFRILERVADGFMTVEDDDALDVMRRLAAPVGADPAIVAGESGGAGLAGVIALLRVPAAAAAIGLGPKARVLIINTEGATDPALYAQIVGRQPQEIAMGHSA